MTEPVSDKTCIYCREDCSARPRVRDDRGRYACRSCIDQRKRAHPRPAPSGLAISTPSAAKQSPSHVASPAFLEGVKQPEPVGAMCPGCGKRVALGHVICLGCGTNVQTGSQAATKVNQLKPKPVRAAPVSVGIGAAFSAGGGLAGLGLWFLVSQATGEPSFVMTVVVGFLAGLGMLLAIRGSGRLLSGTIACGCAVLPAAVGLAAMTPEDPPENLMIPALEETASGFEMGMYEVENHGEDEYRIAGALWLALGCCTAFAFGGSNPDPDEEADEDA